ncbi:MAG: hypothetical protein ACKOFA_06715, partial [Rhodoluna sp.]
DVFGIDPMAYITYIRSGLEAAKQLFGEECISRLTYIPNPGKERQETVNRIRQELGCAVDDTLLPVESKISRMPQIPKAIISHYSSSLINLASVTGGRVRIISAWHHEFSHFQNLANWRQAVERVDSIVEFIDLNSAPSMFGLADSPTETEPLFATMYEYKESLKATSHSGEA